MKSKVQGSKIWFAVAIIIVILVLGSLVGYYFLTNNNRTNSVTGVTSETGSSSLQFSQTIISQSTVSSISIATTSQGWLTYHNNLARTGLDAGEPSISNMPPTLSWKSQTLDGAIYAEPLVDGNMVIAATENNSVYALDANTGKVIWQRNLGAPVSGSSLPCGDINPSGITGTPAIDGTSNTIFAVAYLKQGGHTLFALNVANGHVVFQRNVDPPGVSALVEQERGALAISQGMVYIPYGGLEGDCGQYHGFVIGVPENDSSSSISYQDPTGREGGIWASSGIAVDSLSGDLYVATGNSETTSSFDFGDAVIKLSPSLKVLGYFAPSNWASLNSGDVDLGSVAPLLVGNNTIFQIGKQGVGYLLNQSKLGTIGGEEFSGQVCSAYGGLAYSASVVYVPCNGEGGIRALNVNPVAHNFTQIWTSAKSFDAGPPIVSGGGVWSIDTSRGILYGLNETTGAVAFSYSLGSVAHFSTPSSGDGHIFVAGNDQVIAISD